jgi:hypothetical protein
VRKGIKGILDHKGIYSNIEFYSQSSLLLKLNRPQGFKGDIGPIGLTGIQGVKGDKVICSVQIICFSFDFF